MIILDTNIISEVVRPSPSKEVISWLNDRESVDLCVTTIALGEISYGIEALPEGKRRSTLAVTLDRFIERAFGDRVLVFDRGAAKEYGQLMANRRGLGRRLTAPSGQIAAIASRSRRGTPRTSTNVVSTSSTRSSGDRRRRTPAIADLALFRPVDGSSKAGAIGAFHGRMS